MKIQYYLLILFLALTSCVQYQYMTLDSDIYDPNDQHFIWENDTMMVQYSFSGKDCPLNIKIQNKLDEPLFVDWKKSAVIYEDGSSFSLWDDQANVNTATVGGAVTIGNITVGGSQTTGKIAHPEQIGFIPPHSNISYQPIFIRSTLLQSFNNNTSSPKVPLRQQENDNSARSNIYHFDSENSPFSFRCFLTLSTTEDFSSSISIDNPFWVTSIVESKQDPSSFPKADNSFYVAQTTTTGHILNGVGIASLVVGAAYIDAATVPRYHYHHYRGY